MKRKLKDDSQLSNKRYKIDTSVSLKTLKNQLDEIYSNPKSFTEEQLILDKLRSGKTIDEDKKNLLKEYPFVLMIPNMISMKDTEMLQKFMKTNEKLSYKTVGDKKRKYYFSESYQIYFPENELKINALYSKSEGSPTDEVDQIIEKICESFYLELKKAGIDLGNDEKQLNVFLPFGEINPKTKVEQHLRWHQDSDDEHVPEYTLVVQLDEQKWSGGNFMCQYTGKNVDVYRKEKFTSPIITIQPQYRGGIILRNEDTRHAVDEIVPLKNTKVRRSVIVLQINNFY